eukprot:244319_1
MATFRTQCSFLCALLVFLLSSTILLNLKYESLIISDKNWNEFLFGQYTKQSPNIIFILADDLGIADVGYNSVEVHTPTIDYLASSGIKLTNYYTLCICSASRGVLLTGRYDIHNGLRGIATQTSKKGISLNYQLISDILHEYGNYSTYFIGKWHVGRSTWKQTPTWRGFDYFYGMLGGASDYFTHFCSLHAMDWSEHIGINCDNKNCSRICEEDYGIYSTQLMSNKAIEIILNHTNINKLKKKPFFIYLSYQAIHSPGQVPYKYILKYINKTTANAKRMIALAMIDCMDEGIKNITNILKQNNLFDNTIIIFTSDNGAAIGTSDGVGGQNWPLRGGKHSIYEGGTKVPAIIHYSNYVSGINGINNEYNHLFHSSDWMPTLIEAVGININKVINYSLDGKSHWTNLFKSQSQQNIIRKFLYYGNDNPIGGGNAGNKFGIRYNQYKLLYNGGGGFPNLWYKHNSTKITTHPTHPKVNSYNLVSKSNIWSNSSLIMYDIVNDPLETTNVFDQINSKDKNIQIILMEWKKQLQNDTISINQNNNCGSHVKFVKLFKINHSGYTNGIMPACVD